MLLGFAAKFIKGVVCKEEAFERRASGNCWANYLLCHLVKALYKNQICLQRLAFSILEDMALVVVSNSFSKGELIVLLKLYSVLGLLHPKDCDLQCYIEFIQ